MKLYRTTTTVQGMREPMIDWYQGATQDEAKACWDEDCHRYGLPMDKTSVVFTECDPVTLKPL